MDAEEFYEYGLQPTQDDNLGQILGISDDDADLGSRIYENDNTDNEDRGDFSDIDTQRDVNNSIDKDLDGADSQEGSSNVSNIKNITTDESKGIRYTKPSYYKLMHTIEDDFKENLTLHLYSSYLTRMNNNLQFPLQYWYAWPLNTSHVPDPKSNKKYVDFIESRDERLQSKLERIEQKSGNLTTVELSNPHSELAYEFENLYQKILFEKHTSMCPESMPSEILDGFVKRFVNKFDEFIEKIIWNQVPFAPRKKMSIFSQKLVQHPKKRAQKEMLLDWTDILALAVSNDSDGADTKVNYNKILKKCENLFIEKARNYIRPEFKLTKFQRNLKAKRIFKKALKRVEQKRILAQKIIQRNRVRTVSYSKSKSSKMFRKNCKSIGNSIMLHDKDIKEAYLIR